MEIKRNADEDYLTVIIKDDESNSSDKDAWLDYTLSEFGTRVDRVVTGDAVWYSIEKRIFDSPEFNKKFLKLVLSL
jgi:hypothetical protein